MYCKRDLEAPEVKTSEGTVHFKTNLFKRQKENNRTENNILNTLLGILPLPNHSV